jgi:hypothetical protein
MVTPGNEAGQAQPWVLSQNAVTGGFNPTGCPSQPETAWAATCIGMENSPVFTQSSASFYWKTPSVTASGINLTPSGTYHVTYPYRVADGSSGVVGADFIVEGPTSPTVIPTDTGSLQFRTSPGETDFGLFDPSQMWCYYVYQLRDTPCFPGITFAPEAELPADYTGVFQWVQLITEDKAVSTLGQSPISKTKDFLNGNPKALDNAFPYQVRIDDRVTRVPPAPDPAVQTTAADGPTLQLCPQFSQVTWTFSADMYLLWQPTTNKAGQAINGIYVPLAKVTWGFEGTAYHQQSRWMITLPIPASTSVITSPDYPQWSYLSLNTKPTPCQ